MGRLSLAVVGHVEHVSLGYLSELPSRSDIVHLSEPCSIPGGGGGVSFYQLTKSPARVALFSAVGCDAAGQEVRGWLAQSGAEVHLAERKAPHTRDIVLLTPDGERTIIVLGQPLHPLRSDPLPWEALASCDGVYFTAQDPELLVAARSAPLLMVSARRREALLRSGVRADVVVGSAHDEREVSTLADYGPPPRYLVMTEGKHGGVIEGDHGRVRFAAPPTPKTVRSTYGAGDSFAGALLYFLAAGLEPVVACERAGVFGAAVLTSSDTLGAQLGIAADSAAT